MAEISSSKRTFLLIDGLDECPRDERAVFFATLFNPKRPLPHNLNLLITSRRERDIDAVRVSEDRDAVLRSWGRRETPRRQ